MLKLMKKLIPEKVLKAVRPYYHGLAAVLASFYYGRPSNRLIVIGITGTTGKSTTAAMLAHILNNAESRGNGLQTRNRAETKWKCGYITTVSFFDGEKEYLNKHGLSMPGGWLLQKHLRQIADSGCGSAVVECTSEGLAQNRHLGVNFDMALFTNFSRAHLEAHGSYGNYQRAKGGLFAALGRGRRKSFFPKKMLGVNLDDALSGIFFSYPAEVKFGVSFKKMSVEPGQKVFYANLLKAGPPTEFELNGDLFVVDLLGVFNAQNASLATAAANMLGVSLEECAAALKNFNGTSGRMERVPNSLGLFIIVDYGCEPASFRAALEAAALLPHNRLFHVFGSTGGHRDKEKRFEFGKTSAQFADYIIITNDDIYDSDPAEIAQNIAEGVESFKLRKPPFEIILDRRSAIAKALSIAKKGDLVLITGKGSEQFLVLPGNKRIDWDEVGAVKEELAKLF